MRRLLDALRADVPVLREARGVLEEVDQDLREHDGVRDAVLLLGRHVEAQLDPRLQLRPHDVRHRGQHAAHVARPRLRAHAASDGGVQPGERGEELQRGLGAREGGVHLRQRVRGRRPLPRRGCERVPGQLQVANGAVERVAHLL